MLHPNIQNKLKTGLVQAPATRQFVTLHLFLMKKEETLHSLGKIKTKL